MGLRQLLARELRELAKVNASERPWEMPMAAALASGLPIFVGAAHGELGLGLVGSLGGLVFLYLPATRLSHRMAWLMACAFGMTACHALGLLGHLYPAFLVPLLAVVTTLVTMVCRFYAVPPPASLFFVMAAAISAYSPLQGRDALAQAGAIALGTVSAVGIAFVYSLHMLRRRGVPAPVTRAEPDPGDVMLDAIVIGAFVGLSLLAAHALRLDRPYWVPVSCMAIIQGASLRAAWTRQLHRIFGTAAGLALFFGLAQVPLGPWGVAGMVTVLTLLIETLVVRHYGLAAMFITPLTILLAEAGQSAAMDPQRLMHARLVDTIVGALLGMAGAACLHSPRFRSWAGAIVKRIVPGQSAGMPD